MKETTMTTWHNHTFNLRHSIPDSPIDLKCEPAKNRFCFKPIKDPNDDIYLYKMDPHCAGDISDAWAQCSNLLPQPGATLTWFLPEEDKLDKESSTYKTELKALVKQIEMNKLRDPSSSFERLVGTVPGDEADNPVAFYRVQKVFKNNDDRILLIALVNLVNGGAPVGTVAAEN
jgi:hypothetical protein